MPTATPPILKTESVPDILTKKEAAAYLRISVPALTRMTLRGQVPSFKLGNKLCRYRRADLERLAAEGVKR